MNRGQEKVKVDILSLLLVSRNIKKKIYIKGNNFLIFIIL